MDVNDRVLFRVISDNVLIRFFSDWVFFSFLSDSILFMASVIGSSFGLSLILFSLGFLGIGSFLKNSQ